MPTVRDNVHIGRTTADLKQTILDSLYYIQTRIPEMATTNDWYMALAYAVRDRMMNDWIQAFGRGRGTRARIVSYLSAEGFIGPQLGSNLLNVHDIRDNVAAVLLHGLAHHTEYSRYRVWDPLRIRPFQSGNPEWAAG